MDKKIVRTRIAPSPTGFATAGNMRTALFNYLFAKKHGGEFLIRIEDTDSTRFVEGAEQYIIDALAWLGIKPDVGVKADGTAEFRQSEMEYRSYAELLIAKGRAYHAFDTPEELERMNKLAKASGKSTGYNSISRMSMKNSFTMSEAEVRKSLDSGVPHVIRFDMPRNRTITFTDSVKGTISFESNNLDDKVLFKSDGMVAYHMANVIDDHRMGITHVLRGDEWVVSTPLHVLLYEAFGWETPEFCHIPLVLGPDRKKLSKRKMKEYGFTVFPLACSYKDDKGNDVSVPGFKDLGYEPDAFLNYIAYLGWNPGTNVEFMNLDELIAAFSLERVNNSGAIFDIVKLNDCNAHYMRTRDRALLWNKYIWPHLTRYDNYNHDMVNAIVDIAKERCIFAKDLYSAVSYFFEPVALKDDLALKNPNEFQIVMTTFLSELDSVTWDAGAIKTLLDHICEANHIKVGKVLPDLRMALTGGIPGPHLHDTMWILGKDDSIRRISNLLLKAVAS